MNEQVRRLDGDHDMTFGNGIADMALDDEACAQNVRTRLLLLQSEWFLDTQAGIPWLQDVMTKPANLRLAESIVKQTILETKGVSEIRNFAMIFDRDTRKLTITVRVANIYGGVLNIKVTK